MPKLHGAAVRQIRRQQAEDHGRYIYAYSNLRTKQVVYSLTKSLSNHHSLKQLPDAGANTRPPTLRKDDWKPLYATTFPKPEQGLHAYRKLVEYKKLHETCWTPPGHLKQPHTQEEIDELQDKLDERGGSKTESVYDVIKRKKKKVRVRMVLNQKANSVADLAAVLIEQDDVGAKTSETQEKERGEDRKREVALMLSLVEQAKNGGIEKLDAKIARFTAQLGQDGLDAERSEETMSKRKVKRRLYELGREKQRMEFSVRAVADAQRERREQPMRVGQIETHREQVAGFDNQASELSPNVQSDIEFLRSIDSETAATMQAPEADGIEQERVGVQERSEDQEQQTKPVARRIDYLSLLPSFPRGKDDARLKKRGPAFQKLRRLRAPVFTTEGVTVKWNNILDAEWAESWPESVTHEPMGLNRHTAPKPTAAPMMDVAEWRAHGMAAQRFEPSRPKRLLRPKRIEAVKESVVDAVRKRLAERHAKRIERKATGANGDADAEGGLKMLEAAATA